jgi:hypothetical protein
MFNPVIFVCLFQEETGCDPINTFNTVNRHTNMTGLNMLMGSQPVSSWNRHTHMKRSNMLMESEPVSSWNRHTNVTEFCSRRRRVVIPLTCLTLSYVCARSRRRRVLIHLHV